MSDVLVNQGYIDDAPVIGPYSWELTASGIITQKHPRAAHLFVVMLVETGSSDVTHRRLKQSSHAAA